MPKLYFRYGTMASSKSANLLMVAHNYQRQGKRTLIMKPHIDIRDSTERIVSRTGLERKVDFLVEPDTDIRQYYLSLPDTIHCILIDEAQFLEPKHIEQLREITSTVPVICYGLRTNFLTELFPASKRLMELADSIEEVKMTCVECNRKAIINAKYTLQQDKKVIVRGGNNAIDLGGDDKYQPMCWNCFKGV